MTKNNGPVLISGAVVFKEVRGKKKFLVVRPKEDDDWQIAKATVRRGESSVRAAIRMMGEQAGMNARVLEEAGRTSGVASLNGKSVQQKYLYYLMFHKAGGEVWGFEDHDWLEYSKAAKKLTLKREKDMLRSAREVLRQWEKKKIS